MPQMSCSIISSKQLHDVSQLHNMSQGASGAGSGQGTNASLKLPIAESLSLCESGVSVSMKTSHIALSLLHCADCLSMVAKEHLRFPMTRMKALRHVLVSPLLAR